MVASGLAVPCVLKVHQTLDMQRDEMNHFSLHRCVAMVASQSAYRTG